eukprot:2420866-Pleurochrysis_carterae.AAC.1
MKGDMSQHALDSPARNPVSLSVPTAVATPDNGAYVQLEWRQQRRGQTLESSATYLQPQQIDYPSATATLREALDKQIANREKHQSIV